MRASEGLADRVLDGSDDSLHCSNASVVLGEGDKLDVEVGDFFFLIHLFV